MTPTSDTPRGDLRAMAGPLLYQQNVLQPSTYGLRMARAGWEAGAPHALFTAAHRRLTGDGGRFVGGFRAVELITARRGVAGVVREARREVRSRAVLLCDGGFQGNPELVARYILNRSYVVWFGSIRCRVGGWGN